MLIFFTRIFLLLTCLMALISCKPSEPSASGERPPTEITVITVKSQPVTLQREFPGRVAPSKLAEVRARVSGVIEKRLFVEGSAVKAGQSLFHIESTLYQVEYEEAEAAFAKAEANLEMANYQAKRTQQLFEKGSVSELDNIHASTQLKLAKAELMAAKGKLSAAQLNLQYTKVLAPVSGFIGKEQVTEGALVSQSQATLLAVIQQVDPVYVNFNQDVVDMLGVQRSKATGQLKMPDGNAISIQLTLPDGSTYDKQGKLLFADVSVDSSTGQVPLRAVIDNTKQQLMPGMFVQVKVKLAEYENAFLLPQQMVVRSQAGDIALVVDEKSVLTSTPVKVVGTFEGQWIVTEGLKNGDKVLFEGSQKARPGSIVNAIERDVPKTTPGV